jgi:hypothetical protein
MISNDFAIVVNACPLLNRFGSRPQATVWNTTRAADCDSPETVVLLSEGVSLRLKQVKVRVESTVFARNAWTVLVSRCVVRAFARVERGRFTAGRRRAYAG